MHRLALLCLLALGACMPVPDRYAVAPGDLPPIPEGYRHRIVEWARAYYPEPAAVRRLGISDPVLVRDETGRLLWLVCVEAEAPIPVTGRPFLDRHAFGFAPNYVSAPLSRNGATLIRQDCDRPLVWRPWAEPTRRRGR